MIKYKIHIHVQCPSTTHWGTFALLSSNDFPNNLTRVLDTERSTNWWNLLQIVPAVEMSRTLHKTAATDCVPDL